MKVSASSLFATMSAALVVSACQNMGDATENGFPDSADADSAISSSSTAVSTVDPDWLDPDPVSRSGSHLSGDYRDVLIADEKNHRIVGLDDMDGSGEIDLVLPNDGEPQGFYENWNADRRLYITDGFNDVIIRSDDLDGTNMIRFGQPGWGPGHFWNPRGIVVDALNRIYVVDSGNNRIVRIDDMNGTNWVALWSRPGALGFLDTFYAPNAIALDGEGRIYVADAGNDRIVRVDDMDGSNWTELSGDCEGTDWLDNPMGVYVSGASQILVADTNNDRIVQVSDMTGRDWTTFGTKGDGTGQFNAPRGINDFGLICIADSQNDRLVQIEDITGAGWRTYGFGGGGAGELDDPDDVWDP